MLLGIFIWLLGKKSSPCFQDNERGIWSPCEYHSCTRRAQQDGEVVQMLQENTKLLAKAVSDFSVGLTKIFIYVISKNDRTGSDKVNNSWDDISASQITLYLLWAGSHPGIVWEYLACPGFAGCKMTLENCFI